MDTNNQAVAVKSVFLAAMENAKDLPFQAGWSNGTGYFDGAVEAPVEVGTLAKSQDPSGRLILMIGTVAGTVVLFQRYTEGFGPFVVVSNAPAFFKEDLIVPGSLPAERITAILSELVTQ